MDQEKQNSTTLKFTGDNWTIWKFQTEIILKSKGLIDIVNGTTPRPQTNSDDWDKKDARAQEIIAVHMEEKPMTHIISCQTSIQMWDKLKSIYEQKSQVSIHLLQQRFFSLELKGDVAQFISQLEEIKGNLKQLGEEISEKMVMTKILMSLPDNLKHFVSAWESTDSNNQNLKELTSRLLIEEERIKGSEQSVALASNSQTNTNSSHNNYEINKHKNKTRNKRCNYCKKPGHLISECWFKKKRDAEKENPKPSNAFINSVALTGESTFILTDWCMDTGASDHMCYNRTLFSNIDCSVKKLVKMGNGSIVTVAGMGQVELEAWNGEEWVHTELNEVLYIPEFKINLFSVVKALDKGYKLYSNKNTTEIRDSTGRICATAVRQGKFFKMNFKLKNVAHCNIAESILDWHNKLVHMNFETVKRVLKENNVFFKDNQNNFCKNCLVGKQHRLPFKTSNSQTTKIGQLIHADLCGPFENESIGGANYFLLLKDDFSNYRVTYFIKNKSETRQKIELFIKFFENQSGNKIKTLRTDNGLEFVNEGLNNLLAQHGIKHEKSCTYTPQQNGRAERENRTLVEAARTLIHSKNLDKKFWAEAINTIVFVLNRVGLARNSNKTSFQLLYGKDFNINFLKTFGVEVSVHIPKEKRRKLDPKNKTGILVGYDEQVKGYRIYFQETNKVEIHRDIIIIPEPDKEINKFEEIVMLDIDTSNDQNTENDEFPENDQNSENNQNPENNQNQDIEETIVTNNENIERNDEVEELVDRRGRKIKKPAWYEDYETSFFSAAEEPLTLEEALTSENASKWEEAVDKEMCVLKKNNTWSEVKWPINKKVIQSKWVFKIKTDGTFKARLVARGFQQQCDDMYDIYAPVAKLCTFRILLVIACIFKLPVFHMDVQSAFLYGDINDEVYMSLPGKDKNNSSTVCKLNKSIYGLKKSPKCWNSKFDSLIKRKGFLQSQNDFCLYYKNSVKSKIYVLLYVDDILILGTDVQDVKQFLHSNFCMKDLGIMSHYLGINIKQNVQQGYVELDQSDYLKQILQTHDMNECNSVSTPMEPDLDYNVLNNPGKDEKLIRICRKIIGSLLYAVSGSRPDLCTSVNLLSRFQDKANDFLLKSLKRVLRYVKGTIDLKLLFKPDTNINILRGYVDSDWGGDVCDRKSTTGYVFKFFNCSIIWASKKQQTVAISSTESEFVALAAAVSEVCWLRKLLSDFDIKLESPTQIFEDNQSAINIAHNPENNKRIKHMDIKFFFIKEKIDSGLINITHIKSDEQIADGFTKPLSKIKLQAFVRRLGLE